MVVSGSVLANDAGPGTLTAGPASIASANGGHVAMSASGTFLYTPPVGFAGPSDSFGYTLTDGNGVTDNAVVTINLGSVVWYVNSAAAAGDGRSHSPFNAMPAAATAAQANQIVYVHAGSPAGSYTAKAGQTVWGAGAAFNIRGLTITAGAHPLVQGTIVLADNTLIRALRVNGGAGAAISANGLTGTETLNDVSITGGATGLDLTNVGGTLNMIGGSIAGVTAGAVSPGSMIPATGSISQGSATTPSAPIRNCSISTTWSRSGSYGSTTTAWPRSSTSRTRSALMPPAKRACRSR